MHFSTLNASTLKKKWIQIENFPSTFKSWYKILLKTSPLQPLQNQTLAGPFFRFGWKQKPANVGDNNLLCWLYSTEPFPVCSGSSKCSVGGMLLQYTSCSFDWPGPIASILKTKQLQIMTQVLFLFLLALHLCFCFMMLDRFVGIEKKVKPILCLSKSCLLNAKAGLPLYVIAISACIWCLLSPSVQNVPAVEAVSTNHNQRHLMSDQYIGYGVHYPRADAIDDNPIPLHYRPRPSNSYYSFAQPNSFAHPNAFAHPNSFAQSNSYFPLNSISPSNSFMEFNSYYNSGKRFWRKPSVICTYDHEDEAILSNNAAPTQISRYEMNMIISLD